MQVRGREGEQSKVVWLGMVLGIEPGSRGTIHVLHPRVSGRLEERITEQEKKKKNEFLDWLFHIGIAVIVGVLIVTFVVQRTIVHDISMEPTLTEGDNLFVEKLSHRFGWLKGGDIIVIKSPDADILLIKRLVAVEGDRVEVIDGKVYVNGEIFLTGLPNEPETPQGDLPEYTDLTVPEGMVYLLGDNRLYSHDSTEFGPVEKKWITGRALFRIFPFDRFGAIDRKDAAQAD